MSEALTEIWSLIEINRLQEAQSRIQKELIQNPSEADLYYVSAYIFLIQNENSKGLELTIEGLSMDPLHEGLKYLQFRFLTAESSFLEAEIIIIELLSKNPSDVDYLNGYSRLMMNTFHINKARQLCDEALRLAPHDKEAQSISYLLNICDGKDELSDRELASIVRQDPDNETTLALVAMDLMEKKRYALAQSALQELIKIDPNDQSYIDAVIEVRLATHWTSKPIWLFHRFGWTASIGVWLAFILIRQILKANEANDTWLIFFAFGYLVLVIYSWIQPFLLRAWLTRRGI